MILSRRQVLRLMVGASAAVVARPRLRAALAALDEAAAGIAPYGFLSAAELATLDAATLVFLPADARGPGAREIGVVGYIHSLLSFAPGSDANCDRLVSAADLVAAVLHASGDAVSCPHGGDVNGDGLVDDADVVAAESAVFGARPAYGGGPFSGRNRQPNHLPIGNTRCEVCHSANAGAAATPRGGAGAAGTNVYPPNAFRQFLPLSRLHRLSWTVRLLGVDAVPALKDNPLAGSGPDVNLRARYREGLASLDTLSAPQRFVDLPPADQAKVLDQAAPDFVNLLQRHVIEGTLCAPEYGGNRDRLGWQLVRFDGDSQPLGYEIYDAALGGYVEREDKPNSGPDVGERCDPFSDAMAEFLSLISTATGGGRFDDPTCFEVGS